MSSNEKLCLALGARSGVPSTDKEIDRVQRVFRQTIVQLDDFAAVRPPSNSPSSQRPWFQRLQTRSRSGDDQCQLELGHTLAAPPINRQFTNIHQAPIHCPWLPWSQDTNHTVVSLNANS
mmetsp:Transcript_26955/g.45288  ORF Transcript_26955/g.45288 Transcript_26955/m.45288 type:complete len:120 (-) Transcript_26955:67-426(-)